MNVIKTTMVALVLAGGIWAAERNNAPTLAESLDKVIIPKLSARESTSQEVFALIEQECFKASGLHFNYVMMGVSSNARRVTLNLKNVSVTGALACATQAAGLAYRIEPHAVVIYRPAPPDKNVKSE